MASTSPHSVATRSMACVAAYSANKTLQPAEVSAFTSDCDRSTRSTAVRSWFRACMVRSRCVPACKGVQRRAPLRTTSAPRLRVLHSVTAGA